MSRIHLSGCLRLSLFQSTVGVQVLIRSPFPRDASRFQPSNGLEIGLILRFLSYPAGVSALVGSLLASPGFLVPICREIACRCAGLHQGSMHPLSSNQRWMCLHGMEIWLGEESPVKSFSRPEKYSPPAIGQAFYVTRRLFARR